MLESIAYNKEEIAALRSIGPIWHSSDVNVVHRLYLYLVTYLHTYSVIFESLGTYCVWSCFIELEWFSYTSPNSKPNKVFKSFCYWCFPLEMQLSCKISFIRHFKPYIFEARRCNTHTIYFSTEEVKCI